MKTIIYINMMLVIMLLNACKNQELTTEDIQQQNSNKLQAGTWRAKTVMKDNVDVSTDYASFTLTIGANNYTTTNGGLAWRRSGTWAFLGQSTTTVVRDSLVVVDFAFNDDASLLKLNFNVETSTYKNGKVNGLKGVYEFDLVH